MIDAYRTRPGAGDPALRLTRPERDVLATSGRGAMIPQVAVDLGLPEPDVRAHLASAIRKLGARSKLEAVIVALRRGEIAPLSVTRHGRAVWGAMAPDVLATSAVVPLAGRLVWPY